MLYLIGAFVSSALVTIVMKAQRPYVRSNAVVLAVNYLICLVMAYLFIGSAPLFPTDEKLTFTLLLGAVAGVFYVSAYKLLQWNVVKNGSVLSAAFMKLGVLVPTVLAIVWFKEKPTAAQVAGLVLAVGAILLLDLKKDSASENAQSGAKWALIALLITGGSCDGFSKVFEVYGSRTLESHFLMYLFFVAFCICVVSCIVKKERPSWKDPVCGALIGIPNYLSTRFLLLALSEVPAVIAYPTFSVSAIVVVMAAGLLFFKERLTKRQFAAIGIILVALVLLNI